jgi:hypothetical protein
MPRAACLLLALALLGVVASTALAAETSRAEYVAAVEPICRANTKANERIFAGAKAEVRAGELKPAATQFTKAAAALKTTIGELKAVPQPIADQAKLGEWLGYASEEASQFEAVAAKLRSGQKGPAEHLVVGLTQTANRANLAVLAFGFHYCRLEPSRFT